MVKTISSHVSVVVSVDDEPELQVEMQTLHTEVEKRVAIREEQAVIKAKLETIKGGTVDNATLLDLVKFVSLT